MMPAQLKETTMDPTKRTLLRVESIEASEDATKAASSALMGTKPEARFRFIQEHAAFAAGRHAGCVSPRRPLPKA